MPNNVQIYDSTLRDGAQAEGITYSLEDKLLIARELDELGVHYIEGGWPNPTNPTDQAFFERAGKEKWQNAILTAFGSTRRPSNRSEDDPILKTMLDAGTATVTIFGKTWDLHVSDVLKTTLDENLALIEDSVRYLISEGREVVYDAEHFFDGYKDNPEYALKTLEAASNGGAGVVVLCDTNGGTLVSEAQQIMGDVAPRLSTPFGIHAHNDGGMAAAISVAAVEAGATHVQGVINGFGERCGNANLCSVIPALELKLDKKCLGPERLGQLMKTSRFVSEVANIPHDHRQPYVGETAFAHKGGAHVDAMLKNPRCYEHVTPDSVGNERRYLLSDQSGGATVTEKLSQIVPGIDKKSPVVRTLLEQIKQLEHEGYEFEAAGGSFELLAHKALGSFKEHFHLISYRTIDRKVGDEPPDIEAIIKLDVDGDTYHKVAGGDGPVNALDNALRLALQQAYPSLLETRLVDYKVRVINGGSGTEAKVRVWIEATDGTDLWGTVGVAEDIIEASWIALVDSYNYRLLKDTLAQAPAAAP